MVDAMRICILPSVAAVRASSLVYFVFCVRLLLIVRSTIMGNSRASESGTDNRYGSHAFLFL